MTDLTTMHLKCLLDQATPGPWKFKEEKEWEHVAGPEYPPMLINIGHIVKGSDGRHLFEILNDTVLEDHPGNLRLAAAAPQLAEEVIHLREHIEELITAMEDKAATGESQAPAIIAGFLKEIVLGEVNE
ncbi:hypothetical protein [Corynebacterium sp. ACRPQ]|uniref:hypothetical protein n=1 Tax=Corynebacterium sp. ACRPQ TaxID=2918201 RepID=UPI001EF256D2|nr:hypothetical protein [Corynebacterium sp. ACRPQ]MCG7440696.1 hypothetical protein [Corynebacterium sp. ACRPQ]